MALRMRQSLAQLERDFLLEAETAVRERDAAVRHVARRTRHRHIRREKKRRSVRFYLLTLSLVLTAVIVAVVMLTTLYLLLS